MSKQDTLEITLNRRCHAIVEMEVVYQVDKQAFEELIAEG